VPQESPAKFEFEETVKGVLKGLELCAPVILDCLAVIGAASQRLQTVAAPYLEELAKIDWAAAKRRLDEMPEKSKKAMILASSKGWFFGWSDSLDPRSTPLV